MRMRREINSMLALNKKRRNEPAIPAQHINKQEEKKMKSTFKKIAVASILSLSLATGSLMMNIPGALAANGGVMTGMKGGMMTSAQNAMTVLADTAGEIVSGTVTNGAAELIADTENAQTITVTDENSQVKIEESGTYIITGSASNGNITVKKGTTGVVLILEDLDLTSTTGAAVSVNKESEVKIVVSGSVTLTDAENPEDETSEDAEVADAYDGAALKIKAGSSVYLTGDGTLTVNGAAKNGIKAGEEASLIIDGQDLTVDITAANDGINASYDLTIASGTVTVSASDDAIHADRILTVGSEDNSTSPTVNIKSSTEGLEGTVVNIYSGTVNVTSTDDAINAANKDSLYDSELAYSINITGGSVTISSRSDGLDSNGNINLTGGSVTISSASFGGEAGIDYDGQLHIGDAVALNNQSGIAGPDQMGGRGGQMGGMFSQNGQMNGQDSFGNWNENGRRGMTGQQAAPTDGGENGQQDAGIQQAPETDANTQATPDSHPGNGTEFARGGQNGQAMLDRREMNQQGFGRNGFGPGGQTMPQNRNGQFMPGGRQENPQGLNGNGMVLPGAQQMTPPDAGSGAASQTESISGAPQMDQQAGQAPFQQNQPFGNPMPGMWGSL